MMPVTPSPRRPGVRLAANWQSSSFLTPPLTDDKNEVQANKKNFSKEVPVHVVTPHKKGNRPDVPRSPNSFMPIHRPFYNPYSPPPASPYPSKVMTSPSPSLMSATSSSETETMTWNSESMTPTCCASPSPTYLRATSHPYTPVQNHYQQQHKQQYSNLSSPGGRGGGGYATPSPRTSPMKKPRTPFGGSPGDDSSRRQRVKTELCMHYTKGRNCPFGLNCTYAHGEEELQKTRLMDLQRAGLVEDVDTYRTKPCLTWVATGSCPFGKRCSGIHDPRIVGSTSSWLPHTETQGNSMSTDINVDGLHQKRLHTILYGNPFGDQFSMELDDWADLYKLICNTTSSNKRRRNNLSEIHKLSIALQMRGDHDWMYKYRPQHIIHETLCMVLQKRAFRLENSGKAVSVPIGQYNSKHSQHVLAREIAFGPDSDPTVRGVALWFNIPEGEVAECTPQQAKRFRWKKPAKYNERVENKSSVFDTRECILMIRPYDLDAFQLATDILKHRYLTVKAERLSTLSERFEALKVLQKGKDALQETFRNHMQNWITWSWPINTGRQRIDDDTPVPPVDGLYTPLIDEKAMNDDSSQDCETVKGSAIQPIWESFVSQQFVVRKDSQSKKDHEDSLTPPIPHARRRLPFFARLGYGEPVSADRSSPHILRHPTKLLTGEVLPRQSERCWRALLLKQEDEFHALNEWEIVRDHFQNARCKKVLTIIQQ